MFARFFIDRPVFAWVIALLILLGGGIALRSLPVSQYPSVAPPALAISFSYPGATPQVIEETVISLIEQEMNGIEHLLYMESSAVQGSGNITLTFQAGTQLDLSNVEAQNRIRRVENRLPEEVRRQGITTNRSARNNLLFASIYSPDRSMDHVALGSFASSRILDALRRVKGVGEAQLFGTEYSMRLWLQPDKLHAYQLSAGDVIDAVRAQNAQLAIGEVGEVPVAGGQQVNAPMLIRSRLSSPEEFARVVVRARPDGSTVRIGDIARVELGAQSYSVVSRLNGEPTANIGIRLTPDGNALETATLVKRKLAELEPGFPPGVRFEVPYDTSVFIEISIREVVKTLFEAMGLVFLVMWLFLGRLRATLIPAIVVPVALIGSMMGLWLLGYSINLLTLFAMVLAIGIVVDDAIVVVENVERIMAEEGLDARSATHKAMSQIVGAIIGITLVLTAVFLPMLFFGGAVGVIYRQFAITLLLSMGFSALMALTLTPALCAALLHHGAGQPVLPQRGPLGAFNRYFARVTTAYRERVAAMLGRPGRWLAVYAALLAATAVLYARLPGGFLPEEDRGLFTSVVSLPAGATQPRTLEVLQRVDQWYREQPEVAHRIAFAGFSFFGNAQSQGQFFLRLKDWSERPGADQSAQALIARANAALSQIRDANIFTFNLPPIPELGQANGFDFRLQDRAGLGREALLQARAQLLEAASGHPALAGVRPEGLEPGPQLRLEVDRDKALALGVDIADLNETMQAVFGVAYINDFVREGRVLRVQMQADAGARGDPETLLSLPVRNRNGHMVALDEFARAEWTVGPARLERFNGVPALKIAGAPAPGRSTGEALSAMAELATQLPPGIGFEWAGNSYEEQLSSSQAPALFALSLIVVFLCLAALYESWSIPFAVLLVVPLGVLGALLAVSLRDLPNDVYFKIGLIAIIGLSSKNAILIIEFARELQERGMGLIDATLEASRLRFRPILMTSIAFILGVLPLAVSTGAGAQSRHAIGTGVMGGMIGATVLAVFLVPVFFLVVRRLLPGHPRHRNVPAGDDRHA